MSLRTTCALSVALLCGCANTPPMPEVESSIASAIALPSPVVFMTEAGPLDEPDAPPGTLTLSEAVRRAVMTDPGLQAALARVRVALAEAGQARLLPNPFLTLAFKFPEAGGRPVIEASLTQDLISILRRPRAASAADHRLRQSAAQAVTVALDLAAEVQERYAAVQALDELMPLLRRRQELIGRLLVQERSRLQAGEGTRQDVATLDTQRIELEVEIADREREQRDERLRLTRLLGQPSGAAGWSLEPWRPPGVAGALESDWIETALVHRPEVQAAGWKLAALGDEVALAGLLPWDGLSAGVEAERDDGWSIGPSVGAPIPIFDTGRARRDRAVAEQIEARHELTLAKRMAVEEVRRALESLSRSESNLRRVRDELIPLQEQRRSLAESSFHSGLSDITALFLAEQDLQGSLAKAVDLEREVTLSLVRLQRAVGGASLAASLRASNTPSKP